MASPSDSLSLSLSRFSRRNLRTENVNVLEYFERRLDDYAYIITSFALQCDENNTSDIGFPSIWHYLKYLVDYLAKPTIWNVRIRNSRSSCFIYYQGILVSPSQDCFVRHTSLLSYFFPNTMNIMQSSNNFLRDLKSWPARPS